MKPSENWEEERYFYEKLKQTKIFRYWKRVQFDCQTGKCAYCGKPMQYRYTETDHIKPLYYGGTSEVSRYDFTQQLVYSKLNNSSAGGV